MKNTAIAIVIMSAIGSGLAATTTTASGQDAFKNVKVSADLFRDMYAAAATTPVAVGPLDSAGPALLEAAAGPVGGGGSYLGVVDADGDVFGTLMGVKSEINSGYPSTATVMTDERYWVSIGLHEGLINPVAQPDIYFTESGCQGDKYARVHWSTPGQIVWRNDTEEKIEDILYVPKDAPIAENLALESVLYGYGECEDYTYSASFPVFRLEANDPLVTGVPTTEDVALGAPYTIEHVNIP